MELKDGVLWRDIRNKNYPEPKWVLDGLLSEGLALVASKPKVGKSWIALEIAYACGLPSFPTNPAKVFGEYRAFTNGAVYFDFEMTERRTARRMATLRQLFEADGFDGIPHVKFFWSDYGQLDDQGMRRFEADIAALKTQGFRLFIIDTLTYVMPYSLKGTNAYHSESAFLKTIKKVADRYGVCVLLLTHTSKSLVSDVFSGVSGSMAMTGIPDTLWVLEKGEPDLYNNLVMNIHIDGKSVPARTVKLISSHGPFKWEVSEDSCIDFMKGKK